MAAAFQRRHYEAIARALNLTRPDAETFTSEVYCQWALDREEIASTFARDNPRFDRERFRRATERRT